MVSTIINGLKTGDGSFKSSHVCIDAGSEVDLAVPSTIQRMGRDVINIKDTPWSTMSVKTSSGDSVGLTAIARTRVTVNGVERIVDTSIIPEDSANSTGYDLLLGVPWLFAVKESINMSLGTISMSNSSRERIVIKTGKITQPNFKVMFETSGVENTSVLDEDTSMFEDDTEGDTGDDGEESDKSSDGPQKANLFGNSTRLLVETNDSSPIAHLRYVSPKDYLQLYKDEGPYSHLAKSTMGVTAQVVDERNDLIDQNHGFIILDHDNMYPRASTHKHPFHGSLNTLEATA